MKVSIVLCLYKYHSLKQIIYEDFLHKMDQNDLQPGLFLFFLIFVLDFKK